jgi:hypothetical protein
MNEIGFFPRLPDFILPFSDFGSGQKKSWPRGKTTFGRGLDEA